MSENTPRKVFPFSRIRANDVDEGKEIESLLFEAGYFWNKAPHEPRYNLISYPCLITLHNDGTLSWGKHLMEIPDAAVDLGSLQKAIDSDNTLTVEDFRRAAAALDAADAWAGAAGIPSLVEFGTSICELTAPAAHKEMMERFVEQPDGSIKLAVIPPRTVIDSELLKGMTCYLPYFPPVRFGMDLAEGEDLPGEGQIIHSGPGKTLSTDSGVRKEYPLYSGCVKYFPAALAGIAKHSKAGNDKHHPGMPMHHARNKSTDHPDCVLRHIVDFADAFARFEREGADLPGYVIEQILDEVDAICWRALAMSQELHEQLDGAPLAPGAKL